MDNPLLGATYTDEANRKWLVVEGVHAGDDGMTRWTSPRGPWFRLVPVESEEGQRTLGYIGQRRS